MKVYQNFIIRKNDDAYYGKVGGRNGLNRTKDRKRMKRSMRKRDRMKARNHMWAEATVDDTPLATLLTAERQAFWQGNAAAFDIVMRAEFAREEKWQQSMLAEAQLWDRLMAAEQAAAEQEWHMRDYDDGYDDLDDYRFDAIFEDTAEYCPHCGGPLHDQL